MHKSPNEQHRHAPVVTRSADTASNVRRRSFASPPFQNYKLLKKFNIDLMAKHGTPCWVPL